MSRKKPLAITGFVITGQGDQTTAGVGVVTLNPEQQAAAAEQYSRHRVNLEQHRPKPGPKREATKIRRILSLGLSEREEMEMLRITSRSTINKYRRLYGAPKRP